MKTYRLLKKAYEIDFKRIVQGFLYSECISYAETVSKAKTELLPEVEGARHNTTMEPITFLNIPVIRCKAADKFDFEGEAMTMQQIEEELTERKRLEVLDELLNNLNIKYCYIRKGNYYRPGAFGYTDFKSKAGIFTTAEAVSHAKGCRDIWLERIDIDQHNQMINDAIRDLNTRILDKPE